jgi:hypothetical protein
MKGVRMKQSGEMRQVRSWKNGSNVPLYLLEVSKSMQLARRYLSPRFSNTYKPSKPDVR